MNYIKSFISLFKETNTKISRIKKCGNDEAIIKLSNFTVKLLGDSNCLNEGNSYELDLISSFYKTYIDIIIIFLE